jgi:N-acetylmuramoyl-L-alanine amidase
MITILYYLLKVVLCSTLLYAYYWFVLRNKQFHQYNRFYLMGISVLSWLVPFLKINIIKEQVISAPKVMYFANVIADNNSSLEQEVVIQSAKFTWDNFILFIGITISILFIVRFVKSLFHVRKLIIKYPLKKLSNLYLIMTDVKGTPFSFFKYIFWNTSIDLNGEVGKKILAHEVAHVEANHSFDKLLIELQLIIGWFNPITWLIRNELYLIHEFIADQKSIQNNDTSVLAELLLASAYPSQQHILSNSFFFSPIKRRIQMFTKTNTKYSYLRRLTILPIMAATVLLFAFRNGNLNSKPIIKLDKQYTVIIDAGHGGDDLGASSADGTNEKDLTLSIAQKVKALNNNPNINIVLSRESDKFINVVDRANFANASNANLFVSIHMDKAGTAKFSGTTCYVPSKNKVYFKESIMIANNLLDATSELFPKSKITTREMGIWVLENVKMPSVLFESGFISNPNDLKIVKANEEKIANMLLDGINSYLSSSNKIQGNVGTLLKVKSSSSKDIVEIKIDTIPAKKVNKINLQNKVDDVAVVSYSSIDTGGVSAVFVAPKIQKNADPQKNNEPIFYTTQKPAESPTGWSTYLMNNLDRDLPYRNKAVPGKYTVRLSFVVNQNGDVENVIAENDPGYGTAKEAVRVIQNGPKWIPAEQEGKKVNSLVKQVIIFNVDRK